MFKTADGEKRGASARLILILAGACAVQPLIWGIKLAGAKTILYPDFFGFWSFARYLQGHVAATIYDTGALHEFQRGFGMPAATHYPFLYPPWILLPLAPLGGLPYMAARLVWLLAGLATYILALGAWRWRRPVQALLLLAPSSAVCALLGQNGFFTAALMLGGLRLLKRRPLLAGALLGTLVIKPQLALLVPVYLLFNRQFAALAGAGIAAAALTLGVALAFGAGMFPAWWALIRLHGAALGAGQHELLDMMPTVTAAMLLLGSALPAAQIGQGAAGLAAMFAIWRVRGSAAPEAEAVLPLATILAAPYAFDYDLPVVTGALLAVIAARPDAASPIGRAKILLLLGGVAVPAILPARLGPMAAIVPVVFALLLVSLCRAASPAANCPLPATNLSSDDRERKTG